MIKLEDVPEYQGKIKPADADFPQGSFLDDPTAGAGTPFTAATENRLQALIQRAFLEAGATPNGVADTVSSSQIFDVFEGLFNDHARASNRSEVGAHDSIYTRTVDTAQAAGEDAPEGTAYSLTDRDGARFEVVGASDTGGFYVGMANATKKLKLVDVDNFYGYGVAPADAGDQREPLQSYASLCTNFVVPPGYDLKVADGVAVPHGRVSVFGRISPVDGSTFTTAEVLKIGEYRAEQVGTLTQALSTGFATVSTESTAALEVGEVVTLYNPVDFSWSTHTDREYYRQGEHLKVSEIVSATTFRGSNNIYDNYATGVLLFKLNAQPCHVEALNVDAGTSALYAVTFESLRDGVVNGLTCTGGTVAAVHRNRCYNLLFNAPSSLQSWLAGSATKYAHYTLSCQGVVDYKPDVRAGRHALALTGRDQELSIPNRMCGAVGGVATTFSSAPGVTAVDFHGNTEECFYLDMEINGGANIGGKNNRVRSRIYQRSHPSCIYGGELVNTNHDYSGCTVITSQAGAQSRGQWIDVGGNSGSLDIHTQEGGVLDFRGLIVECLGNPTASSDTIKIINRGYVGDDLRLDLDGLEYRGGVLVDNWVVTRIGEADSGSYFQHVSIKNVKAGSVAFRVLAHNVDTDGFTSERTDTLNLSYPALDLRIGTGDCNLGTVRVKGSKYSGVTVNGSLGADVLRVTSTHLDLTDCNSADGGNVENNSALAIRQVAYASLPSVLVEGLTVDPAANAAVRLRDITTVRRGIVSLNGYPAEYDIDGVTALTNYVLAV